MLSAFKHTLHVGIKAEKALTGFQSIKSSSSARDFSQHGTRPPRVDTVGREANKFRADIGFEDEKSNFDDDDMEFAAAIRKVDRDVTESVTTKFEESGRRMFFGGIASIAYTIGLGLYFVVGERMSSKKVDGPSAQQVPRDGNAA